MFSSVLWAKAYRQLRAILGLGLVASVLIGAGTGTTAGLLAGANALSGRSTQILGDLRAADVEATLDPIDPAAVSEVLTGAGPFEMRMISRGTLSIPGGKTLPSLSIYQRASHLQVNSLALVAGRALDPADPSGVVIDRSLAMYGGIKVGDLIVLDPDVAPRELKVRGVVISSEFLLPSADAEQVVPSKGSLAVVFLPWEAAEQSPIGALVNDVVVRIAGGVTEQEVMNLLSRLPLAPDGIRRRSGRFDLRMLADDMGTIRKLGWAGGGLFLLLTVFFSFEVFRILLAPWRSEAGVLRALGIPKVTIAAPIVGEVAVLALLAAVVSAVTSGVMGGFIAEVYRETMGLPGERAAFAGAYVAQAACLGVAMVSVAALLALVPRAPPARPGRFTPRLNAFSMPVRMGVRGLWRRPAAAAAQTILLALAAGFPAGFAGFSESWQTWAHASLAEEPWDAAITFRNPVPLSAVPKAPGLTAWPYLATWARVHLPSGGANEIRMWGMPSTAKAGVRSGGVVIPERFANANRVRRGDPLTFHHGPRSVTLTVTALTQDVSFDTVYAAWDDITALTGGRRATGALVHGSEAAVTSLATNEIVSSVVTKAAITTRVAEYLRDVGRLADLAVPFSWALGALLASMAARAAIIARVQESNLLQTLGFSSRELAIITTVEMTTLGLGAALLAPAAAWGSAALLNAAVADAFFSVPLNFSLWRGVLRAAPVFILAGVAALWRVRRAVPAGGL